MNLLKIPNKSKNPLYFSKYCDVCSITMNNEKKERYFSHVNWSNNMYVPVSFNTSLNSDCECMNFETKQQCDIKLGKKENWEKISTWTSCKTDDNQVNVECLKTQLDMVDIGEPVDEGFANLWRDLGGISTKSNMKPLIKRDTPLYIGNATDLFESFEYGPAQERMKERICFEL